MNRLKCPNSGFLEVLKDESLYNGQRINDVSESYESLQSFTRSKTHFIDHFLIDESSESVFESIGIVGILVFILLQINYNQKRYYVPKFLSVTWLIFSYKIYLENTYFEEVLNNKINVICGVICLVTGLVMCFNIHNIFFLKKSLQENSLFSNLKILFNIILFNYSFNLFDVEKINTFGLVADSSFQTLMNYMFIGLNTFPLLLNYFVNKRLFKLPFVLFPSPIALSTLTVFFCFFRHSFTENKYLYLLEIMCYLFTTLNLISDYRIVGSLSYEHIFFIAVNVFNIIYIYLLSNDTISPIIPNGSNATNDTQFARNVAKSVDVYKLTITYMPLGDGGIQGFKDIDFYIDKIGEIANAFYILSSNTIDFIREMDVRKILLEPKHIQYIYRLKGCN